MAYQTLKLVNRPLSLMLVEKIKFNSIYFWERRLFRNFFLSVFKHTMPSKGLIQQEIPAQILVDVGETSQDKTFGCIGLNHMVCKQKTQQTSRVKVISILERSKTIG